MEGAIKADIRIYVSKSRFPYIYALSISGSRSKSRLLRPRERKEEIVSVVPYISEDTDLFA
jgi:hypothetical protein